jgi:hypothetical protein
MKTFRIYIDFDGRREDGEYLDGRKVQAKDEDEAWEKFYKRFAIELDLFGAGYWIGEVDNE